MGVSAMFYLHLSNRTENLISQLAEVLRLTEGRDPFRAEYFLIQSQGMERMLSQQLSLRFGSWCNYEYLLPTRFFALLAARLEIESGAEEYGRERLCWRLEGILRGIGIADKGLGMLRRYVEDDGTGRKRYQLSQQLAYVFDQYQVMRPEMIAGWQEGRRSTENSAELYQLELWNMLVSSIGHSRHRGHLLQDLIGMLDRNQDYGCLLPERLSVFGIHSLPPLLLSGLRALANHCDVHFYLLSPCNIFWGDQHRRQALSFKSSSALGHGVQGGLSDLDSHPLLASLGTQGRDFQNRQLLENIHCAGEFSSFEDPCDSACPSLLQRIQSDLLHGEVRMKGLLSKDESLLIVSAHSPHRELMIFRDRILSWLDADPDLSLKDVVVMAPDIQDYSALIPAIFHDIPHSVADKNPALNNPFLAVFLQFLRLCGGRFGWSEVLELLGNKEVYPLFEIREDELDLIRHWVISSGIRWGLSADQKEGMGLSGQGACTWQSGLDRLMMGYATDADEEVAGIVPYRDIEGSMALPLGGLSLFCELLEKAVGHFTLSHSLRDWSEILSDLAERLFVSTDGDGLLALHGLFGELRDDYAPVHGYGVSYEVICTWFEGAAEEKRSSSGFLRGQLTFCSMLPMRSIPFKKVCLLGLNDGVFPQNDFHPPFDLLGEHPVPGDRSRRSDDRYQFLEAILSARGSLYLSYVGQSIRSNETLPPSVVLSELLELLALYGVSDAIDVHPLHGFSESYFDDASPLFSYDRQMLGVCSSLPGDPATEEPWWQGQIEGPEAKLVDVTDLVSFFRNPQKYFVRRVLGIHYASRDQVQEEEEPFLLKRLQGYLVEQDLVRAGVRGRGQLLGTLQAAGRWPLGAPGSISFAAKQEELQSFVDELRGQVGLGDREEGVIEGTFCGLQLSGRVDGVYQNGLLLSRYASLKGKDVLAAWVQHCLVATCLGGGRETRLLSKDYEVVFPSDSVRAGDLAVLLQLFQEGCQSPSRLRVEPAFAYACALQKRAEGGKGDPKGKAMKAMDKELDTPWDAEGALLARGVDCEDLLNHEVLELCDWFYTSLWKRAHVRTR